MATQFEDAFFRALHTSTVEVAITDVRIPFWSLVWLLVKVAIAAIPAAVILGAAIMGLMVAFSGWGFLLERIFR
ncbi:MAG: hypothetical protein KDE45_03305 [Caldilineaceae bacterium]|nr:hypothetical protein [Caldilineaceae bacterium]